MANSAAGWTPEWRKGQIEAIRRWQPLALSTGPTSAEGKARISRNAWTGGTAVQLRKMVKELNQTMREQRRWLGAGEKSRG